MIVNTSIFYASNNQIDSIDIFGKNVAASFSNLEGNVWNGSLAVLDENGEVLHNLPSKSGASCIRYINSGLQLLAGRDDGNVVLYSNHLEEIRRFSAHDSTISSLATSPSNYSQFASSGWDGCLSVFDWRVVDSNTPIYYTDAHYGIAYDVTYNPMNENQIATVGKDGFARVWDLRRSPPESSQLHELGQSGTSVVWAPNQEHQILVGLEDGRCEILDQRYMLSPVFVSIHKSYIRRLRVQAENDFILCTSDDTNTSILQFDSVGSINTVAVDDSNDLRGPDGSQPSTSLQTKHRLSGHEDYVSDAAWMSAPDSKAPTGSVSSGSSLLTCSWDKRILKFDFVASDT